MTSTAAPADEQISEILAPPRRWRRVAGWTIAVVLAAAAIGVPLWWRSAAGSMRLTRVDPPLEILPTTITMRQINLRSSNPEGPEQPFAPLTIEPGGEVMLLFTLDVPNGVQMSEGSHTFFDAITMNYRAMNIHFEKQVPIGYWIGLDRPSPGGQACQPERH